MPSPRRQVAGDEERYRPILDRESMASSHFGHCTNLSISAEPWLIGAFYPIDLAVFGFARLFRLVLPVRFID